MNSTRRRASPASASSSHPEHRGLLIARVFDSSPAMRAGLQAGEVIVAVNGRKLAGLSADAATSLIKGPPGTEVALGIERGGRARIPAANTARPAAHPAQGHAALPTHGIDPHRARHARGDLRAGRRLRDADRARGEARRGRARHVQPRIARRSRPRRSKKSCTKALRGIVFDLRANGGGLVEEARLIASMFIAHGTIVSTRGRTQPSETITATGDPLAPTIPMVVLVDHNTASSSEIVTAALQDHHRATVVGTHTFGKGVFQEEQPLSNGGALDITVGEYFTPNGRNLGGGGVKQGAGITPEVPLANNVVDTPQGLDVALNTLAAKVK